MRERERRESAGPLRYGQSDFTAAHGSGKRPKIGLEPCAHLVLFEWPFLRGHQHAGASMADPQQVWWSILNVLLHEQT